MQNKKKENPLWHGERDYLDGPLDDPSGRALARISATVLASLCAVAIGFRLALL